MRIDNVANIGAELEANFTNYSKVGDTYNGFEILDIFMYKRGEDEKYPGVEYPKAITVKDGDGNIYVHFKGTGDGNWGYNAAAYGGPLSCMQWVFES